MELVPDYVIWQTYCKSGVELSMAVSSPALVCQPANTLCLTNNIISNNIQTQQSYGMLFIN